MIIYYDLLFPTVELCSDALPSILLANGSIMSIESKKIPIGGEVINIGANVGTEEVEEQLLDKVKTVVNVVHSHNLTKIEIDKKLYMSLQNKYWKSLLNQINLHCNLFLYGDESKFPSPNLTKDELKVIETDAISKLDSIELARYQDSVTKYNSYKANFSSLQKFIKENISSNFDEFEFYRGADPASLDRCMIIPARYVGEAISPTFYFFLNGLVAEKI